MTDIQSLIRTRVDAFVLDLSQLIHQAAFEQLSAALGGIEVGNGRSGRKTSKVTTRRAKGSKRSAEDFEAITKNIIKVVTASPGIRADQIAAELGTVTKELQLPIKKLLAEKVLTKKGQKRATTYSAKK